MNIPLNIDIQQILLHLLNFVILAGGLYLLLYSPVKKFMDKRTQYYADMEQKASEKMASAQQLERTYQEKLKACEDEIRDMKAEASLRSRRDAEEYMANVKRKCEVILENADVEAKAEKEKILADAQKEISALVVSATEKMLAEESSAETDAALYDRFINTLGKEPSAHE